MTSRDGSDATVDCLIQQLFLPLKLLYKSTGYCKRPAVCIFTTTVVYFIQPNLLKGLFLQPNLPSKSTGYKDNINLDISWVGGTVQEF